MKFLQILLVAIIVSSCAPIRINYDYEKNTDFTKYKTYNYYSDLETGMNELDTKRLIAAIDTKLQTKGLTISETPDFFINIQSQEYHESQRSWCWCRM